MEDNSNISHTTISDSGGVAARHGFKYQDHIAAQFVLEMINNPSLKSVECETSDDVTLNWSYGVGTIEEYVQVKTTENDKKWSKKELYERSLTGKPTSLMEKSLLCDVNNSNPLFRIVSKRDVAKSLRCLTLERDCRDENTDIVHLASKFKEKYKTTISKNGNDLEYWGKSVLWQVSGDISSIEDKNIRNILSCAEKLGVNPTHSHSQAIYTSLLNLVDIAASASRVTDWNKKTLHRSDILKWWNDHLDNTETANLGYAKPYRVPTPKFFETLHEQVEKEIKRGVKGYDSQYELKEWRTKQLAQYLSFWLPEISLKASELSNINHLNLQKKMKDAIGRINKNRELYAKDIISETLLHSILRHEFKSEPIACKIFLNANSDVKIFRNAHIIRSESGDEQLWLGQAAISSISEYKDVQKTLLSALEFAVDSNFLNDERDVIISLLEQNHLTTADIVEVLDSNESLDKLLKKLQIAVLIAYDSEFLSSDFYEDYRSDLVSEIQDKYTEAKNNISSKISEFNITVNVFFVPMKSVIELENQFIELTGINQ